MIRRPAAALAVALLAMNAASSATAAVLWTPLGTMSNASDPSVWEAESFDVTALIGWATRISAPPIKAAIRRTTSSASPAPTPASIG